MRKTRPPKLPKTAPRRTAARRPPPARRPDPQSARSARVPALNVKSLLAFGVLALAAWLAWLALAPDPMTAAERATFSDEIALHRADNNFEQGQYQDAIALFEPLATKGNGHAQVMLANIYLGQKGVPYQPALATQWARKAANQEYPEGLMLLSRMYLQGDGAPKDPAQARALIQRAVALDSAEAKGRLGVMFLNGMGVERNPEQARKWLNASAKQGFFGAQVVLGRLALHEGTQLGIELPFWRTEKARRPPVSAEVRRAAEAGDAAAQLELGRSIYAQAVAAGDKVVEAQPWIEKSAANGNVMAQFAAGALYIDDKHGVPYSAPKAQAWFDKGVAQLP